MKYLAEFTHMQLKQCKLYSNQLKFVTVKVKSNMSRFGATV